MEKEEIKESLASEIYWSNEKRANLANTELKQILDNQIAIMEALKYLLENSKKDSINVYPNSPK